MSRHDFPWLGYHGRSDPLWLPYDTLALCRRCPGRVGSLQAQPGGGAEALPVVAKKKKTPLTCCRQDRKATKVIKEPMDNVPEFFINRREALRLLVSIGLGESLKIDLDTATNAEVKASHAQAMEFRETLYVDESGTILLPSEDDWEMPTWREAFGIDEIKNIADVHAAANGCWHLEVVLENGIEIINEEREHAAAGSSEKFIPLDVDDLETAYNKEEHAYIVSTVDEWADEVMEEPEWLPLSATPNGQAYLLFEDWDPDIRDCLGIQLVEGDHPGSSFMGAQIFENLDDVNKELQGMGIPLRFEELS